MKAAQHKEEVFGHYKTKALEALEKAKAIEARLIARGATYVNGVLPRTKRLRLRENK